MNSSVYFSTTLTHTANDNPTKVPTTEKPVTGETDTAMSATEVSSKIHESNYNQTISDLIYGRQWGEAIEEELQNLEQHNTWEYFELLSKRVAIGSKWVFKVKYNPDGSVDIRRVIQWKIVDHSTLATVLQQSWTCVTKDRDTGDGSGICGKQTYCPKDMTHAVEEYLGSTVGGYVSKLVTATYDPPHYIS